VLGGRLYLSGGKYSEVKDGETVYAYRNVVRYMEAAPR
jgi:quercetin dioxygenase-like cupin family protein